IMIVTGTINLGYRGFGVSDLLSGSLFLGTFGKILLQKLIVVAIILLLSILHDFWIGPLATSLIRKDPLSPKSTKYRRIASWLGRINFIMAIIVVALAVTLVRGGH
ncbi:MAG: DUF4149 domain-containing protein, partial [Candidatus Dadabacteria bacterium]|nr:DUF4149 domain-containing protein [Candidatus Dadabacteria bacterium]NIQ13356.1 DUF4149 domain-containing protein [Candidatus Dadabacteria bacterium]